MLAKLDQRGYARDLLRDANLILEKVLFPMSFPWAHDVDPVIQTIPRDIDEMNAILSAEEVSLPDDCKKRSIETEVCVRKSGDPGVIEYSVLVPPTKAYQMNKVERQVLDSPKEDNPDIPGELSLRYFEETAAKKRLKSSLLVPTRKTTEVSFKAASTSSCSTILTVSKSNQRALILPAVLPQHISTGLATTKAHARELASSLGSYNCGNENAAEKDAKESHVKAGRTRLVWSEKASTQGCRSLFSAAPIDHKRPREVKVGLRINGSLLTVPTNSSNARISWSDPDTPSSITVKVVERALATACDARPTTSRPSRWLQCSLNSERFLADFENNALNTKGQPPSWQSFAAYLPYEIHSKLPPLLIVPPQIYCVLTEDGLIRTTCAATGNIKWGPHQPLPWNKLPSLQDKFFTPCSRSTSILMECTATSQGLCSICGSKSNGDKCHALLMKCVSCDLSVHHNCYGVSYTVDWKCNVCLKFGSDPLQIFDKSDRIKHRWATACHICKQKGGALVCDEKAYAHNVCKTWKSIVTSLGAVCCICSKNTQPVVGCAAVGCNIQFHPMCALILSNAADLHGLSNKPGSYTRSVNDAAIEHDKFLCTQYRLAKLDVGRGGNHAFREKLPVAFCGIHNPDRRDDFYGFYPGGQKLAHAMSIPSLRPEQL
jgi:hypothetical protein